MPRQRQNPADDDGGIDLDELLEEVKGLRAEREELRQAMDELRTASTPTQRRTAERDVRSAESGLVKALRAEGYHDITLDDLEQLRVSRRRHEFEEWYEERRAAEQADADDTDKAGSKSKTRTRSKSKPATDDAGDVDDAGKVRRGYFG